MSIKEIVYHVGPDEKKKENNVVNLEIAKKKNLEFLMKKIFQ